MDYFYCQEGGKEGEGKRGREERQESPSVLKHIVSTDVFQHFWQSPGPLRRGPFQEYQRSALRYSQKHRLAISALLLPSYVTLGKLLHLSVPLLFFLYNGTDNGIFLGAVVRSHQEST